eukprot:gene12255-biopygen4331
MLHRDAAGENFLDIAFGPPATPRRPLAALGEPTEVHEDPHAIRGDASGPPRDPPATPTSPWAAQGKEMAAMLHRDAAGENFLDIAFGPAATPRRPLAALEDPAEIQGDPHAIRGDASGTPPDPPATPTSPWAAQGKEIAAILHRDAAGENFLDIAFGPPATPRRPLAALEDPTEVHEDPHAIRGDASGTAAILHRDAAGENFLDIAFGPPATSRRPLAALEDPTEVHEDPHAIRGDASGTPRDPPATPTSPWAAQGKEIAAIVHLADFVCRQILSFLA